MFLKKERSGFVMICDTICEFCRKEVKLAHGIEEAYMYFNRSGIRGGETMSEKNTSANIDHLTRLNWIYDADITGKINRAWKVPLYVPRPNINIKQKSKQMGDVGGRTNLYAMQKQTRWLLNRPGRMPGAYLVYFNNVCVLFSGKRGAVCGKQLLFKKKTVFMSMSNITFEVAGSSSCGFKK